MTRAVGIAVLAGVAGAALSSSPAAAAVQFTDVTVQAGVDYVQYQLANPLDTSEATYISGGAAAGDYDGDGWVDLFATRLDGPDLLFHNRGDGTFEEVADAAGLGGVRPSNGAAWGDVDNDGYLDLFVTALGSTATRFYLFVNDGTGHFTEEAVARGASVETGAALYGTSATFGDYDLDGWLDLQTAEWRIPPHPDPAARLLHNRGLAAPGHFADVTDAAGVSLRVGAGAVRSFAFAPRFADLDLDGYPELIVSADFGNSRLFWNNGDGTFQDGTAAAGVGSDENGMGSALGDYDNDGRLDWFVSSIFDPDDLCGHGAGCGWGATGNRLYHNDGNRTFSDRTDEAGVRDGYWGWGSAFLDYDNDGDLDVVMTNGVDFAFVGPPFDANFARFTDDPMRLWENDGSGHMTEVSAAAGLTDRGSGKGLLTFDYDRDGDLDLFVVNNAGHPVLYRNDGGNENGWLRVETVGTASNRQGLGARVRVLTADGRMQLREVNAGSHFLGQSETAAHFGLGPVDRPVLLVQVEWPRTGRRVSYAQVPRNSTLLAIDPGGPACGMLGVEALPWLALYGALRTRRRRARRNRRDSVTPAPGARLLLQ